MGDTMLVSQLYNLFHEVLLLREKSVNVYCVLKLD
jgi:hypothetical protein